MSKIWSIKYHNGDLFRYVDSLCHTRVMIPHVVNNINVMGRGFVVPLYNRWPIVKEEYHRAKNSLGECGLIQCEDNIVVVNMCAQDGVRSASNRTPLDYMSLKKCMLKVRDEIASRPAETVIVAPKFGCGLAGGNWSVVELMIKRHWSDFDITVCVQ